MKCILALDQGTSSSRALVFDHSGAIRAMARRELTQFFPRPAWVEHDPLEIWRTQVEVAREALGRAGGAPAAIAIANQRETTVVWDRKTGLPVYNAIVWQDRRTAEDCDRLKAEGALVKSKTGLVVDPYFSATKLRWILDNVPDARRRAEAGDLAFGTIDSWLVWNLTGRHVTDVSNASRTMLFNIHTGEWDEELLALFNVPKAMLPAVRSSSEIYGETDLFQKPIPVAGIAGDQQAALFGQACTRPGMVKNTYGTGCFMLMNTGEKPVFSHNNLLTTIAWKIGGRVEYAHEGSVFIAGAVVHWLRDGLGIIRSSAEVEQLARSVPDSGGVYFVPAFSGLGAPHWDPYARGLVGGLSRGSSAAHIARAALESIAFQSADVLEAMVKDSGIGLLELRVDGGAAANDYLMQFQADILNVPVVRPAMLETTALGAACLAGLAVGYWKDQAEIALRTEKRFEPQMESSRRNALRAGWLRALDRAKSWAASP